MSITELKETAEKLTAREWAWLRAYLFAQERGSDPAWKAEMARRRRRLAMGGGINQNEYARRAKSRPANSGSAPAR
jgi:hypothetical protein